MNVLTKLFVVTLVVLALLETAAFVVFVQRVNYTQQANLRLEKQMNEANAEADKARNEFSSLNLTISGLRGEINTKITAERTAAAAAAQRVADKDNQIAELNKQIGTLQLDMANLTNQSQLLATVLDAKDKQLTVVRAQADDTAKKYDEVARALQDREARLAVAEREWRAAKEQVAALETQVADMNKAAQGGIAVAPRTGGGAAVTAAKINGRVTKVTKDNGQVVATINVGQADGVAKGMRFTVYDNERGIFLGFLTVQAVDSNTAIGNLEGPKVAEVAEGASVQNQM